jgi:hypothetical protein
MIRNQNHQPLVRFLLGLALAGFISLIFAAEAQTFNGALDAGSHPTEIITITLAHDGALSLNITTGPKLNLNANASVGVTEGVIVYDSTGVSRLYGALQAQGSTATHVVNGLGAGTYYVRLTVIGDYASLPGDFYSMIVSEIPDPLANDSEPNDTIASAKAAALDTVFTGHLGYLGSQSVIDKQDFWYVHIPADGTLQFEIATGEHLNLNINESVGASGGIILLDSDGSTAFWSVLQAQNSTNTYSVGKLKAGTYYLRLVVIGAQGYYGSYRAIPRFVPEPLPNDSEPNDQSSQAQTLTLDIPATGHLGYYGAGAGQTSDEQDWWRVTLPHAGALTLSVETSQYLNLNINAAANTSNGIIVYDADASTILYQVSQAQHTTNNYAVRRLKPGTYFVRLSRLNQPAYYGAYRLTPHLEPAPQDLEINDSAAAASPANLGTIIQGNLGYHGGGLGLAADLQDWWKFTMPASTGQLQLVVTTLGMLNLNQNAEAGATEGITIFKATATGTAGDRVFGTVQAQGTTQTYNVGLSTGNYFLRLVKLNQDSYWGTYSATLNYSGAPIISNPANTGVITGQPITYPVSVLGGATVTVSGLPQGLTFGPASSVISGTLNQPGTCVISVTASNSVGVTVTALTLTALPLPTLQIQSPAPDRVVLTWPSDYSGFSLVTTTTPQAGETWQPVTQTPTQVGNTFAVTNTIESTTRFYRLKQN